MNKSHLIHLGWAVVAVAAFTIGSKSSTSSSSSPGQDENDAIVVRSARISNRGGSGSPDGPGGSASRQDRSGGSEIGQPSGASLSEAGIRDLGRQLKEARGPLERREIFSEILRNLTAENARLMREQILHLETDSSEFREFHYAWGQLAGEEAVLHGAESPERDMATTLAGWAAANPDAALAYFNGLDENAQRGGGMKWGAVYGLFDADPNLAVGFAMDQQAAGDKEAGRLMDVIARQMLRTGDPGEVASWASGLPAGEMQDSAVARVAREFADEDPVATLDWAETLPEGNGKIRAVREGFSEWARDNPQAAADRLSSMPASRERDHATLGYATRVAWEDPQAGIAWANTINDDRTRSRALIDTGRAFFRKNPEAAKQWLANSGLNEEQQRDVTRRR